MPPPRAWTRSLPHSRALASPGLPPLGASLSASWSASWSTLQAQAQRLLLREQTVHKSNLPPTATTVLASASTSAFLGSEGAGQAPAPQPLFLGPAQRPLFAVYHPPQPGRARDVAVLICGAWGAEDLSTHQSLQGLAATLAANGLATLRLDWDGCGNASGGDEDPQRLAAWLASIRHGVTALRAHSGSARVALVGLRLGALLSAQCAADVLDLAAWIGIACPASGRQYLREALAMGSLTPEREDGAEGGQAWLESGGFAFSRETREAIAALSLDPLARLAEQAKAQDASAAPVRLWALERSDFPKSAKWVEPLRASGLDVAVDRFDGYAAWMDEPHRALPPQALFDTVVAGLVAMSQAVALPHWSPVAVLPERTVASWAGCSEQVLRLPSSSADAELFGVLTRPVHDSGAGVGARVASRGAVLLLNAGAIRHVGPSRLYVTLARRWAEQGLTVLRLDLSGLGESAARPGQPLNMVYGLHAVQEVADAARWLARETGVPAVAAVGLCAGAHHALQAAISGAPISQLCLLNPLTFDHRPGTPVDEDWGPHQMQALAANWSNRWLDAELWRKLWRGDLTPAEVGRVAWSWGVGRLARALVPARARLARWLGRKGPQDLGHELRRLAARGVHLDLVFADNEPGLALLRQSTGRALNQVVKAGALAWHHLPGADHIFSRRDARSRLTELLDRLILPKG